MSRRNDKLEDVPVSFRLRREERDFLRKRARRNERDVSKEIRLLIREAMDQERRAA